MRAPLSMAVVLPVVLALLAPPALAAQQPLITPSGGAAFPQRTYVLSLPDDASVLPSQVRVTENGEAPADVSVSSASGPSADEFGVVLVIDASASMRGESIREAIRAARALAAERAAGQQLGVVAFNSAANLLLPLTTEPAAIDGALAEPPPLAPQTHVRDAVVTALDQIEGAGVTAGSIVVLSDGADTGSRATAAAVGRRARRANVRIFSVGLRSGAFEPSELRALAAAGRGRYTEAASPKQLEPIFDALGAQLAREYLIRYSSSAAPDTDVRVSVRADGVPGVGTHTYRSPGTGAILAAPETFWTSTLAAALLSVGCALMIGMALLLVLHRRVGRGTVPERIGLFVSVDRSDDEQSGAAVIAGRVLGGTERSLEQTRWWDGFKEEVELARIELPPVRVVYCTVAAAVIVAVAAGVAVAPVAALLGLAVPLLVRTAIRQRVLRQRQAFAEQLPDTLQGLASALRAGHGLVGAMTIVVEDAPEPSRTELRRVVAEEQLGAPLEQALAETQRRMDSREVQQIALIAEIQRETGGNMAEVLDRVTESVRGRVDLRRMVQSLTAQGRMSRWVLTALPIALLGAITLMNPEYIKPLFETGAGRVMLAVGAVMLFAGSMAIKKIVNFKI